MQPGLTMQLEQSTRLIMTPQLKQAIELLQMSAMELDSFLLAQIAENPVLEITSYPWEQPIGLRLDRVKCISDLPSTIDPLEEIVLDVNLSSAGAAVKRAAVVLLHSLDSRGFLPDFTAQFLHQVGFDLRTLNQAKQLLQMLGPAGFGTHNLAEAVLLQLHQRGQLTPAAEKVVCHYLHLLDSRLDRIAAAVNLSPVELQQVIDNIRACDPAPGSKYCPNNCNVSIIPDVFIIRSEAGFTAMINQSLSSCVAISDAYRQMAEQVRDGHTKSYIEDCLRSALWVLRALEQRRETLLKIAQALVKMQYHYLAYGTAYLRPLTLAVVADEVGVHESTVSRAIAQKWAVTPRGLLPLKAFFSSGVQSNAGGIAAEAVKEKITQIIAREEKANRLSDEQIAAVLKNEGIHISRRTVAKYRESLGILSSAGRRRYDIMG